jgi:hypothetical protein
MNSRASVTLYQKSVASPADQIACLRHLLADVIILRLRRPGDPKVTTLEADIRARLRAIRGLPPKPALQMPTQLELFPGMAPLPARPSRKKSRRRSG